MQQNILFAFGPGQAFFFYCPTQVVHLNCGDSFKSVVLPRLGCPYSIALGPEEEEYCALYRANDAARSRWHSIKFTLSHPILHTQLRPCWGNNPLSHLTVGPNMTYLASAADALFTSGRPSRGKYSQTHPLTSGNPLPANLYAALDAAEAAGRGYPVLSALGSGGAWVVRWRDGGMAWEGLDGDLRELLEQGQKRNTPSVQFLALSPYNTSHYFLVLDNNTVHYALPSAWTKLIAPHLDAYLASLETVVGTHTSAAAAAAGGSKSSAVAAAPSTKAEETPPSTKAEEAAPSTKAEEAAPSTKVEEAPPPYSQGDSAGQKKGKKDCCVM